MKRVKLVVAYDGTNYHGWQLQNNGVSIEEVLNRTLTELLGEPIAVTGASRTDSGVHAMGNVAVFDTENRMPADKISYALNQRLPEDIRIQSSCQVPDDWHPRKQNCRKTYEYRILNRKMEMPVSRLYTYFCYFPIDVEKMRQAASYLVGEHDFKSFCTVRTQVEDTVRTIYSLTVERGTDDVITIRVSGSGFLYNMVRILAGTLLRVGTGLYPPEKVEEILDARNRQAAGPTLPARGLTLIGLDYEEALWPEIQGENKYWSYCLVQREILPKGEAYLIVNRCQDGEFSRLVARVMHQAVRNGARQVFAADREQGKERLQAGQTYGYYSIRESCRFWHMEKTVVSGAEETAGSAAEETADSAAEMGTSEKAAAAEIILRPLGKTDEERARWCRTLNEIFYAVPNSATYDVELVAEEEKEGNSFYWLYLGEEQAGAAALSIQEEGILELDMIGICGPMQGQGLGWKTLKACEKLAAAEGLKQMTLLVADTNLAAVKLYERYGFRRTRQGLQWFAADAEAGGDTAGGTREMHGKMHAQNPEKSA